jgi:hypothetical protein
MWYMWIRAVKDDMLRFEGPGEAANFPILRCMLLETIGGNLWLDVMLYSGIVERCLLHKSSAIRLKSVLLRHAHRLATSCVQYTWRWRRPTTGSHT